MPSLSRAQRHHTSQQQHRKNKTCNIQVYITIRALLQIQEWALAITLRQSGSSRSRSRQWADTAQVIVVHARAYIHILCGWWSGGEAVVPKVILVHAHPSVHILHLHGGKSVVVVVVVVVGLELGSELRLGGLDGDVLATKGERGEGVRGESPYPSARAQDACRPLRAFDPIVPRPFCAFDPIAPGCCVRSSRAIMAAMGSNVDAIELYVRPHRTPTLPRIRPRSTPSHPNRCVRSTPSRPAFAFDPVAPSWPRWGQTLMGSNVAFDPIAPSPLHAFDLVAPGCHVRSHCVERVAPGDVCAFEPIVHRRVRSTPSHPSVAFDPVAPSRPRWCRTQCGHDGIKR